MTTEREFFYERFADEFDAKMNRYEVTRRLGLVRDRLHRVRARLGDGRLRILDGGSGTGLFSKLAEDEDFAVVSLDLGPRLLRQVRAKCGASCAAGSALALPFRDAAFDVVMSNEVIEHTPDPRRAVTEYARVTRPGGAFVITCPNRAWHWSLRVAGRWRPYQGLENWPGFDELARWVDAAGFDVEEHFGFNLFPFQLPGAPRVLPSADRWFDGMRSRMINQGIVAWRRG